MTDEKFSFRKFLHGLDPLNPIVWVKTIVFLSLLE